MHSGDFIRSPLLHLCQGPPFWFSGEEYDTGCYLDDKDTSRTLDKLEGCLLKSPLSSTFCPPGRFDYTESIYGFDQKLSPGKWGFCRKGLTLAKRPC